MIGHANHELRNLILKEYWLGFYYYDSKELIVSL